MYYALTYYGTAWRPALAAMLHDPGALLRLPHTRILNHTPRSTVALVNHVVAPIVVKIFDESRVDRMIKGHFAGSAARRAARAIERLDKAGFAVPRLVAVLEHYVGPVCTSSCLVTEAIADGVTADIVWRQLHGTARRNFARHVCRYVRRLHTCGFYARDIQACNFVVVPGRRDWEVVLVDLDRVRRFRRLSWSRRRKNLVQIHRSFGRVATLTEQVRFLSSYLGPMSRGELRRIGEEVRVASARKDAEWEARLQRRTRA